jgi:hypothetical protein
MQPYRNIKKGQRCDLLGPPHPSDRLGFCQHLGNFPQAFTQLALTSTATYLDRVLSGKDDSVWRWHLSIKIVPCSGRVVLRALQNTQLSRESRSSSKPPRLQEMANPVKDHTFPIPRVRLSPTPSLVSIASSGSLEMGAAGIGHSRPDSNFLHIVITGTHLHGLTSRKI